MLTLLVADDEKYDRDSIITILNSTFNDELRIREAKNGREAIEIAEIVRPEIIIMDIKMPGINGIVAIQEIKKFIPNCYFIILTAYDYFDFAIEAVKNNVKEYLLKPFSKKELIEKIEIAVNFVKAEKEKRKCEIENQEKIFNLMPVLENELSFSIINDSVQTIDYETYLRYLDMDFKDAFSMVIRLKDKTNDACVKFQVGDYVKEFIRRKNKTITSYRFTKDLVFFVQMGKMTDTEEECERKYNSINLASDIRREVKKMFDVSVRIGIGKFYSGLTEMHCSYKEASCALECAGEENVVVHFLDITNKTDEKRFNNGKFQNYDGEKIALFKSVEQFIADNISEELDLEKTAAKFNLSPFYFSRIFKEMVGYSFPDYINVIRINRAKSFLKSSSASIKEICFSVGYSDPNYFSKVFKKYEGITPTEFKSKLE